MMHCLCVANETQTLTVEALLADTKMPGLESIRLTQGQVDQLVVDGYLAETKGDAELAARKRLSAAVRAPIASVSAWGVNPMMAEMMASMGMTA